MLAGLLMILIKPQERTKAGSQRVDISCLREHLNGELLIGQISAHSKHLLGMLLGENLQLLYILPFL
jgi:hypothetical protein